MMMAKNYSTKIALTLVFAGLSMLGMSALGADPSFSISPGSLTGKLHCEYIFNMIIHPSTSSYNGFESTIRYESGYVLITPNTINPIFNGLTSATTSGGFLYNAWGTMAPGQSSTATITGLTFKFKTLQNLTTTNLFFSNATGGAIVFGPNGTDDGLYLNSSINGYDILTGVNDGSYAFVPLPCIIDTTAPSILSNSPVQGARNVPSNYNISFVLYDWAGAGVAAGPLPLGSNNRNHYRYSGLNTSLANYQAAPSSVDNQEGVNSGTINVRVSCPTCSGAWIHNLSPANLNISDRTGNGTSNRYTRNSKTRGYAVSFPSPYPYEIEKLVTVLITGADNANENGQTHTGSYSFSFNAPQAPTIVRTSPSGSTNISPTTSPIVFQFADDRAGIDTGTISITIPQTGSGDKFYTGHTYSGSELTITLISGAPGVGNSGSYQVSFVPQGNFPSNTIITITGSVYDFAGNVGTYNGSFTTSMSCEDWGCFPLFHLNILGGTHVGDYTFTGSLIIVTGTNLNSPYPYFTGVNNDILMCGIPYDGTILTGNIGIYDTTGTQINGILYTGDKLYITGMDGLDFVLSGNVIIIQ